MKKIDKWHTTTQATGTTHLFSRDDEYVELDMSPTNFDSSSEEDINIER